MSRVGIEFNYYMLPSRRRVLRWIGRRKPMVEKSLAVRAAGGLFEIEEMTPLEVRVACVRKGEVVAYKFSPVADREIALAVDVVINKAHAILVERES